MQQCYSFNTIGKPAESLYKEKNSKFYSFVFPVAGEDDIKEILFFLKKRYPDAHHHCYAYVIGTDHQKMRTPDAGEPNHSAGDPILQEIKSRKLTDVLLVVVRYFGGIKLGVGGLMNTYRRAASDVLSVAPVIEKEMVRTLILSANYSSSEEIFRLIQYYKGVIKSIDWETLEITLEIGIRNSHKLEDRLGRITGVGIK